MANSDRTEFLPMGLFRLVDLVLHLNIISLSITVRVVSLASLLSIDGLSLGHRSKVVSYVINTDCVGVISHN